MQRAPLASSPRTAGLDLEAGPGVDVVAPEGAMGGYPFPDGAFDVVVSSSVLEHDEFFWVTIKAGSTHPHPDGSLPTPCTH
jgi:hypothetical protein